MKMFECCPNVKPENHPPVSGGSDAVAAGEGCFHSQLPECISKIIEPSPRLGLDSPGGRVFSKARRNDQLEDIFIRPA